jgi:hypothetical protein
MGNRRRQGRAPVWRVSDCACHDGRRVLRWRSRSALGVWAMSKWERFEDMIGRSIAIGFFVLAFGVIAWGVIIVMLWIHKAVLS